MTATLRSTLTAGLTGVVLVALAACTGSQPEAEDPADATGGEPTVEAFDVTSARLVDEPFCDRLDPALVASVLGMEPDAVALVEERVIGEKYPTMDEEAPAKPSKVNSCTLGSGSRQFVVSVQPEASTEDVRTTMETAQALGAKCAVDNETMFGQAGAIAHCAGSKAVPRASVVTSGLVGGGKFYCAVFLNEGASDDLREPAVDACTETMELLATDA